MKRYRTRRRGGFTLIEVLLVLIILVIIMGLAAGSYFGQRRAAQVNAARAQIGLFETPLETYNLDMNMYPTTNQGLEALRMPPADLMNAGMWNGPYLNKEIPLDPWGRPYYYACPGRYNPNGYDVWSSGPDMVDGTDDDIGNWSR
jgi:general secretion pathway protein G